MNNEIISYIDNKPIISDEFKENYKKFIELKDKVEEAQKQIKASLIDYFENFPEEDRKQLNFDAFKVSYVKPSTRKTFDSKKFQDEHPEMYNQFLNETEVKATIKFI